MTSEELDNLIKRYLAGQSTPEEKIIVEKIYSAAAKKTSHKKRLGAEQQLAMEQRLKKNISTYALKDKPKGRDLFVRWYAAASIILLITVGYFLSEKIWPTGSAPEFVSAHANVYHNTFSTKREIALPDGTIVTLNPQSLLRVSFDSLPSSRIVFLEGEAFFKVSSNKHKPFLVYTQNVVTRVLGTSFNIKAFRRDQDIKVSVMEGKVSVRANSKLKEKQSPEVILLPNQEVVVNKASNIVQTTLVENPMPVDTKQNVIVKFEDVPALEVFKVLEATYKVKLVYDAQAFSRCKLTSTFVDENLYERLQIICTAIGSTYQVVDTQIVLSDPECIKHNP